MYRWVSLESAFVLQLSTNKYVLKSSCICIYLSSWHLEVQWLERMHWIWNNVFRILTHSSCGKLVSPKHFQVLIISKLFYSISPPEQHILCCFCYLLYLHSFLAPKASNSENKNNKITIIVFLYKMLFGKQKCSSVLLGFLSLGFAFWRFKQTCKNMYISLWRWNLNLFSFQFLKVHEKLLIGEWYLHENKTVECAGLNWRK